MCHSIPFAFPLSKFGASSIIEMNIEGSRSCGVISLYHVAASIVQKNFCHKFIFSLIIKPIRYENQSPLWTLEYVQISTLTIISPDKKHKSKKRALSPNAAAAASRNLENMQRRIRNLSREHEQNQAAFSAEAAQERSREHSTYVRSTAWDSPEQSNTEGGRWTP